MAIPEGYDDDAKKVRHPLLLSTKPKEAVAIPPEDLKVLAKSLGVKSQDQERIKVLTPPVTRAKHEILAWKHAILGDERETGAVLIS